MRKKLSYSALNMLARCGEQFRFRYLDGLKVPPGVAAIVGRGVDASVNMNLLTKRDTGKPLPLMEARELARDQVHREFEMDGVTLSEDEAALGMKRIKADAVDVSVRLAQMHHIEAAPKINATHIQRKWTLEVTGLDIDLTGYIDIQEGIDTVRDTKTAGKSPSADEAANSMQLTTYAMAVAAIDGAIPKKVKLDYLVKTKTPKLVQIESTRVQADFQHVLERVYQASIAMDAGIFTPAPLDAWWCSNRWCGYWSRCSYARRPVSVAVAGEDSAAAAAVEEMVAEVAAETATPFAPSNEVEKREEATV